MHFVGEDHAFNKWVTQHCIKIDEKLIRELEHEYEVKKKRRATDQTHLANPDKPAELDEKTIKEMLKEGTLIKNVEQIQLGKSNMEVWYFTPLPVEYHCECLYICDFCLSFFPDKREFTRHTERCTVRHPPGDEIYRDDRIAFFEVDGLKQDVYCENLCYISRMFLYSKRMDQTIGGFLFYVLCEKREDGFHFVGYFSKEKILHHSQNNLSCYVVMPSAQGGGYG